MNDNPVITMYEKLRTKWHTPTKPWNELDPQRQMMIIQAINLMIQAMHQE
jgi:hypothetical protein